MNNIYYNCGNTGEAAIQVVLTRGKYYLYIFMIKEMCLSLYIYRGTYSYISNIINSSDGTETDIGNAPGGEGVDYIDGEPAIAQSIEENPAIAQVFNNFEKSRESDILIEEFKSGMEDILQDSEFNEYVNRNLGIVNICKEFNYKYDN